MAFSRAMRRFSNTLPAAFAALAALVAGPSAGADLTPDQVHAADEFAINNTWFVLYHELGHMLVDQLGIPVLSREEDVADNIAAYALIARGSAAADRALIDSTYGWVLSDQRISEFETADFYDEHSLDLQRAYAITCMMVGNDRDKFREAADIMDMDIGRQKRCADDFAQVEQSLVAVLGPYLGEQAGLSVVYDESGEDFAWAERILKRSRILEMTAEDIGTSFALPKPITLRASQCGEANAFYDPDNDEVLICYELVGDYFNMMADDMLSDDKLAADVNAAADNR